jgi:hypothetical protein
MITKSNPTDADILAHICRIASDTRQLCLNGRTGEYEQLEPHVAATAAELITRYAKDLMSK